jgi:ABC-2 type transport system permease protein
MNARWRTYRIAYQTIVTKEIQRFLRIWIQTVLPAAVTTALYFLIFGTLIGERIGPMGGVAYVEFIVPGLILMAVISNAYANTVSSFYQSKFSHFIEELLIAPVPNWVILAGFVSGGVARGLVVGLAVWLVSLLFADVPVQHGILAVTVVVLTAILFALAGFINAVFANSFDDVSIIPTFVLTPLTYLGGVFYSVELLPQPWHGLSLANPVFYMIAALRHGLLGVSDIPPAPALLIICSFILTLTTISLWLLRRGTGIKL